MDRWHVRLRDVPASIGWDGLALFLRHLPPQGATARAMDPDCAWSDETHMLATVLDLLAGFVCMYSKAHGGHARKPPRIRRPGDAARIIDVEPVGAGDLADKLSMFED